MASIPASDCAQVANRETAAATPRDSEVLLLPALALLGVALPLTFLAWTERYLYYLRPLELIPTYATAWLLMFAPAAGGTLVAALILRLAAAPRLRLIRHVVRALLLWAAASAIVSTVLFCVIAWLRTFGLLETAELRMELGAEVGLVAVSLALSLPLALSRWGRNAVVRVRPIAKWLAVVGGFALLSLPFYRWPSGAAASAGGTGIAGTRAGARPNILLLTIDALSAQHMSLYGAARSTTPNIDAFARQATVFERAFANGNFTTVGVASILTGTRPWTHRALQLESWPVAATRNRSLPSLLHEWGYLNGYFATNSVAGASKNGLGAYFDYGSSDEPLLSLGCHDSIASLLRYECAASSLPPIVFLEALRARVYELLVDRGKNREFDPSRAIDAALAWLDGTRRQPVFLWVHLLPPHSPYAAPRPWLGRFSSSPLARDARDSTPAGQYLFRDTEPSRVRLLEARYDESVSYVDHYVGYFLERALARLGENTVVVISADHGESFEHGYGTHGGPALYDSIIRIPLIVKAPFQRQGARSTAIAEQVDIAPTVLQLAGIPLPASWEGHSLLPDPRGSQQDRGSPGAAFSMDFEQNRRTARLTRGTVSVIDGNWKLVHYMGLPDYSLMPPLHDELYDLSIDPGELTNLIEARPDERGRLMHLIDEQLAAHGGPVH